MNRNSSKAIAVQTRPKALGKPLRAQIAQSRVRNPVRVKGVTQRANVEICVVCHHEPVLEVLFEPRPKLVKRRLLPKVVCAYSVYACVRKMGRQGPYKIRTPLYNRSAVDHG